MTQQKSYQDQSVRTWTAQQYFKDEVQFSSKVYHEAAVVMPSYTTVQRLALTDVLVGTMVYDTTLNMFMGYGANGWQYMSTGCEAS